MYLKETGYESVGWIQLAQDRVQWQALMNTAMYLGFHKRQGIS